MPLIRGEHRLSGANGPKLLVASLDLNRGTSGLLARQSARRVNVDNRRRAKLHCDENDFRSRPRGGECVFPNWYVKVIGRCSNISRHVVRRQCRTVFHENNDHGPIARSVKRSGGARTDVSRNDSVTTGRCARSYGERRRDTVKRDEN